jgi:hypothetical protein
MDAVVCHKKKRVGPQVLTTSYMKRAGPSQIVSIIVKTKKNMCIISSQMTVASVKRCALQVL